MNEFSILIGGKAGFGIDKSSSIIGRLLNELGYRIYIYRDYPSDILIDIACFDYTCLGLQIPGKIR